MIWAGSPRVRAWRRGNVSSVYYTALVVFTVWGLWAVNWGTAMALFKVGANIGGFILAVAGLQVLRVNTRFLPKKLAAAAVEKVGPRRLQRLLRDDVRDRRLEPVVLIQLLLVRSAESNPHSTGLVRGSKRRASPDISPGAVGKRAACCGKTLQMTFFARVAMLPARQDR